MAGGDELAGTDLERLDKFLHFSNKKNAESGSVERALAAHGSSTVTNKPKDYNDQIEPIEAEDPLVTYVTREQTLAEEELKKIFPQLYPAPIQAFEAADFLNYANNGNAATDTTDQGKK